MSLVYICLDCVSSSSSTSYFPPSQQQQSGFFSSVCILRITHSTWVGKGEVKKKRAETSFFFFFYPQIVLSRERDPVVKFQFRCCVYTRRRQEREKSRVASSSSSSSSPYRSGGKKDREHHAVRWDAPSLLFSTMMPKRDTQAHQTRISYKVSSRWYNIRRRQHFSLYMINSN